MRKSVNKDYNQKRPSHPAEAHTRSKRWFKRKSRKAVRKQQKEVIKKNGY